MDSVDVKAREAIAQMLMRILFDVISLELTKKLERNFLIIVEKGFQR
jgi:hypothetical protein